MFGVAALLPILASCGYVPEPQPVKSGVEITAVYYPGTDQMSEWDVIAQTCPERKPLLGWFDEGNPEAIDWQLMWRGTAYDPVFAVASVPVAIDGQWHEYEVPLAGRPDWTGMVDELWFEACELVHARVEVDWMRFVPKD